MKNIGQKTYAEIVMDNRAFLMGIAIIWVIFSHMGFVFDNKIFSFLKDNAWAGVDIFLFLSGMGIFASLQKAEGDVIGFYKKRIRRIMPAYIPFILVYLVVWTCVKQVDVSNFNVWADYLGNITCTGWFLERDNQFNWYVQAIVWFYLLSPTFYMLVKRYDALWQEILLMVFLLLFQLPFYNKTAMAAINRIPIFILGMMFMHKSMKNTQKLEKKSEVFLYVLMCVGVLLFAACYFFNYEWFMFYGIIFTLFVLITPGLCCFLVRFNIPLLKKCIEYLGRASFEIYLVHIALFRFVPAHFSKICFFVGHPYRDNIFKWFLLTIVACISGVFYKKLVDLLLRKVNL